MVPVYLLVVELSGDADRKRLDYLLEKWKDVAVFRRLCSGVYLVDADTGVMVKFLDDLYSRFSKDVVSIYRLGEPEFVVQPLVLEKVFRVSGGIRDVWGVVDFVMARFKGVLVSDLGSSRVYRVRSRYGVVDLRFVVEESNGDRFLRVFVEGFGEAVPHVFDRISRELSYLEGGR